MTISEFADRFQIKNERLIKEWIDKELIPGVQQDSETQDWIIPDRAWPPYTNARAKNANAIYKSIVKGISNRKYVSSKIYKMDEKEFLLYIKQLVKANIIEMDFEDNIPYYSATLESQKFLESKNPEKYIEAILLKITEAISKGTVDALIEKITP